MTFVNINEQNFEQVSILLRPTTHFVSGTNIGVTGSSHVAPVRSKCIKQVVELSTATTNLDNDLNDGDGEVSTFNVTNYFRALALDGAISQVRDDGVTDVFNLLDFYIDKVESGSKDVRFDKKLDVFRFEPPFKWTTQTTEKNIIRKTLMPYHRHRYDNCGFHYTNYNTFNFLSNDDKLLTASCMIYPNSSSATDSTKGIYDLPDKFTTSFWINPRFSKPDIDYRSGTVLHLSSSIAISIITGSYTALSASEDQFKIMLQLSHSADIPPSNIDINSPNSLDKGDLIFTSSHFLHKNNWHNVSVLWGNNINNNTGSLFIDDNETKFSMPSSSLGSIDSPPALVIGNYFAGRTTDLSSLVGTHTGPEASSDPQGVTQGASLLSSDNASVDASATMFSHPLHAEIHDVRIYNRYLDRRVKKYSDLRFTSPKSTSEVPDLIFYLPPYFYPETPKRSVLVSPFQTIAGTTDDPFNVQYSFGVGGKMINLENYVREFAYGVYPRLLNLRPVTIDTTIQDITADNFTFDSGSQTKRMLTVLPNDNGLHTPRYDILENSSMSGSKMFVTEDGVTDYSIIRLNDLIPTASLFPGLVFVTGSIFDTIVGTAPENPGVAPGSVLTIAQRTKDVSSNEITIFDISNLYYGNKINPGSFRLFESNLTGSNGDIQITIKDNGRGSLYRADALTKHAEFNSVGTLLYDEGIAVIKSPNLPYLGKDEVDISFRGEQQLHTMVLNIPCYDWAFTSSSNPTFKSIQPSTSANDEELQNLYITTVNIHDDNFNIIMKANFAQPIFKADDDEFVIRLKQDF
jgi:hypothetical protein